MSKIVIGTANFGSQYGISGKGPLKNNDIIKIVKYGLKNNIKLYDAAVDYPGVYDIITKNKIFDNTEIITKIRSDRLTELSKDNLLEQIRKNISKNIQLSVLIHNQDFYKNKNGVRLYKLLCDLKEERLIKNIGVSVYDKDESDNILSNFKMDIIQLPINPFNSEFNKSSLKKISQAGIEIHARSIFLQGTLLLKSNNNIINSNKEVFNLWDSFLKSNKISPIDYCCSYVSNLNYIDKYIVGIRSLENLKEIIEYFNKPKFLENYFDFKIPKKIYDPRKW